jgi:pyruvate dehydrogenase E2 component (dihydrolipoamide acetyltransferase)
MTHDFKLPSLGENVTGKITVIHVKIGDLVTKGQVVFQVGTDKVEADLEVDMAGKIEAVLVKIGDEVNEGAPLLKISTADSATASTSTPVAESPKIVVTDSKSMIYTFNAPELGENIVGKLNEIKVKIGDIVKKDDIVMVVGTDKVEAEVPIDKAGKVVEILAKKDQEVSAGTPLLKIEIAESVTTISAPETSKTVALAVPIVATVVVDNAKLNLENAAPNSKTLDHKRIAPLARKYARELGINIDDVPTDPNSGRISKENVVDFAKKRMASSGAVASGAASGVPITRKKLPNFDKFGTTERKPLDRIGVLTAENMSYAFQTIPHAWISEKADITRLESLRNDLKEGIKKQGGNLTTTVILTKAVAILLKKYPQFNASLDEATNEIVFKKFINIGIAVDTPKGLLVPVLPNVDQKNLTELSLELTELSTRTRDGKNKMTDLDGGTFTISNIGGIGGTNMISIVNWPQVAILSITAATMEAHWNGTAFEPRLMMPMTIGWDHRVINGADAARFLVELKKILEEPFLAWF